MDCFRPGAGGGSRSRRVVIVADNSLIVEAIAAGFRQSGEFNLIGYANGRRTSASAIVGANPDVVLLDDMDGDERATTLTRELRLENERLAVIALSVRTDPEWLGEIFDAGATAAISKATHPAALVTLVRETLNGHVFHRPLPSHCGKEQRVGGVAVDDLPLTAREVEILTLVARGATNGDVARRLWVTEQTVKFHLRNIYRKLNVTNRTHASHLAFASGLVRAEPEPAGNAEPALTASSWRC
jgi:DNA-binding NarL/FixJ family response regulator